MLLLLAALTASASDALPEPQVSDPGEGPIVGTVQLAVPPDTLKSKFADPTWLSSITEGRTRISVTGQDGPCQLIHSESPNAIMTAVYDVKRCPTASGFASTLRDSNCFKRYSTSWEFAPTADGTGTVATYRLDIESSLMLVPESTVRSASRKAIGEMLGKLQGWSKDPK